MGQNEPEYIVSTGGTGTSGEEGNTKYLCYGKVRRVTNAQNTNVTNTKAEVSQIPGCVRVS